MAGWRWNSKITARHARDSEYTIRVDLTGRDALALATCIMMAARSMKPTSRNKLPESWPVPILDSYHEDDEWLTTAAVAERIQVSRSTITSWAARGCPKKCPFPAPGRKIHYRNYWQASVVDEWSKRWRSG